jgi:hypothetical protein
MGEITYEQQIDSTLSRECFYAETDTECSLCTRPDCTHYCHTESYKLWRAADNLVAFILVMDIRSVIHGKEDLIKQFSILKSYAKDLTTVMDAHRKYKKIPMDYVDHTP